MLYIKLKFLSFVRQVHSCVHACRRNKEIYPSIYSVHPLTPHPSPHTHLLYIGHQGALMKCLPTLIMILSKGTTTVNYVTNFSIASHFYFIYFVASSPNAKCMQNKFHDSLGHVRSYIHDTNFFISTQ